MNDELESIPTRWTCADDTFFAQVHGMFEPAFLYGAGVLLASYDATEPPEGTCAATVVETPSVPAPRRSAGAEQPDRRSCP